MTFDGCFVVFIVCTGADFFSSKTLTTLFFSFFLFFFFFELFFSYADGDEEASPDELESLIGGLLTVDLTLRLGCSRDGAKDVRDHAWFSKSNFNWKLFNSFQMEAPWVPELGSATDDSCFTDSDVPSEIIIKPYDGDGEWCSDF